MASNMLDHFSLYPQLDYDGPPPNYAELEFPLLALFVLPFYALFGPQIWMARLMALSFSLLSLIFLVLLTGRKIGEKAGFVAGFLYALLPFNIFYNRAVMPEPVLLATSLGSLYFFSLYLKKTNLRNWILSALFLFLAILSKPNFLFLGLVFLFWLLQERGFRGLLDWRIWLMVSATFVPSFLYFFSAHQVAEKTFLTSLISVHMLPNFLTTAASAEFWKFLLYRLAERVLTWPGLVLFAIALLFSLTRKESRFIFVWTVSVLIYLVFSSLPVQLEHDYYHLLIIPPFAVALGHLFQELSKLKIKAFSLQNIVYGLLLLAFLVVFAEGLTGVGKFWCVDNSPVEIGKTIRLQTPEDSLIAIDQMNPVFLFYSERKGWRLENGLNLEKVLELKEAGAQFLAVTSKEGKIKVPELKKHFEIQEDSALLTLFKLK